MGANMRDDEKKVITIVTLLTGLGCALVVCNAAQLNNYADIACQIADHCQSVIHPTLLAAAFGTTVGFVMSLFSVHQDREIKKREDDKKSRSRYTLARESFCV